MNPTTALHLNTVVVVNSVVVLSMTTSKFRTWLEEVEESEILLTYIGNETDPVLLPICEFEPFFKNTEPFSILQVI